MSYQIVNNKTSFNKKNSFGLSDKRLSTTESTIEFYELEPAVVLDVILDSSHPYFINNIYDVNEYPTKSDGSPHTTNDKDYSWIGRVKVRLYYTDLGKTVDKLVWAIPLENNISEYPLINELVIVGKYFDKYFYTRKLNYKNTINSNADFLFEKKSGGLNVPAGIGISGMIQSQIEISPDDGTGPLGKYFLFNKKIRPLQHYEGDHIIESRFGSSIRFGSYINNKKIDSGTGDYSGGYGNPSILIRNKQRSLKGQETTINYPITEDINNDGSSIHITSGNSISEWITTVKMIPTFIPLSKDKMIGDQIIINSDRLIFSTRTNEFFNYSKGKYGVITDDEYSVDSNKKMTHYTNETFDLFSKGKITLNTNDKTIINSPQIYLGQNGPTQPSVLGNNCYNILNELINWLAVHTHWYQHSHPNAGEASPPRTQIPVELQQLYAIQAQLNTILSDRVFIVDLNQPPTNYVPNRGS